MRDINIEKEFQNITLTGEICYLFMCMERYLINVFPDCDWTAVSKRMWQWSTNWWDKAWDIYSQVVPEFILEFDTFEKTNENGYDGTLNKEDYIEITSLLKKATGGMRNDELDRVLYLPIEFGNACEGTSVKAAKQSVVSIIDEIESVLEKYNIALPDKALLKHFEYDIRKPQAPGEPEPGWGSFENTEFLSIVLTDCPSNL